MRIYRNGNLAYDDTTGDDFDDGQLSGISLGMVALDAEIGQGSLPVPGDPGWVAGDRITIYEQGTLDSDSGVTSGGVDVVSGGVTVVSGTSSGPTSDYLIYTGFVGPHTRIRNPQSPLEMTSIYQLSDMNRQLIGRRVVNYYVTDSGTAAHPLVTAGGLVSEFLGTYMADVDLDTGFSFGNATEMLAATYNSDGMMDILSTLVLYTGWTVFMCPTNTENLFEFHFHGLTSGRLSGLTIDDTPGAADGVTVFAPRDPEFRGDPGNLMNTVEANNGLITVSGDNASSQAIYNAGGLKWEAIMNYGVDQDSLETYVNNLLNSAFEQQTYACTIGPLNGSQIVELRPGSLITTTSQVFDLAAHDERIARITLTPSQGGTVAPGLWDAHLELASPTRLPAQSADLGGQGGYAGALTDPFNLIDHYRPVSGAIFISSDIPVGATYRIVYQMVSKANDALTIPGDTAFFTLEMWADVDETVPGDGWSIVTPTGGDVSDTAGQVYVDLTHDTAGTSVVVNVIASR
jgi:hypothetical protein